MPVWGGGREVSQWHREARGINFPSPKYLKWSHSDPFRDLFDFWFNFDKKHRIFAVHRDTLARPAGGGSATVWSPWPSGGLWGGKGRAQTTPRDPGAPLEGSWCSVGASCEKAKPAATLEGSWCSGPQGPRGTFINGGPKGPRDPLEGSRCS